MSITFQAFRILLEGRFSSLRRIYHLDCFVHFVRMELSEAEIAQLKEHNQRRVKRVVAIVAITMTLISIVLVALSLSLGSKIDQLG